MATRAEALAWRQAVRAEAPIFAAKELLSYNLDEVLPDTLGDGDVPAASMTHEEKAERLRRRMMELGYGEDE